MRRPRPKLLPSEARSVDREGGGAGRPPRRPTFVVFDPLRILGHELCRTFNGDALLELASQFLALAEKQTATGPLLVAHRLMGTSLSTTGDLVEGAKHLDKAIALYDRAEHSPLATRFGQDVGVVILSWRSWTAWVLGYPEAALADVDSPSKTHARLDTHPH